MNNQDFTAFCLENMGKVARCKKNKPYTAIDIGRCHLHKFYEVSKGEEFNIFGFQCFFDDQSLLLENKNSYDEFIRIEDFIEYFEIVQ